MACKSELNQLNPACRLEGWKWQYKPVHAMRWQSPVLKDTPLPVLSFYSGAESIPPAGIDSPPVNPQLPICFSTGPTKGISLVW